mmetsp:Transcript_2570/g.5708  ORF Transcript_2570/g.5708 Transcript_2570/m.5708 type:complete len:351 (-) Transcript_2570:544-1596(-)|eukprot:CAMPEP_0202898118 /NCGR_PEP_ID=MMETSP1392-20130828/6723_1 /ASSEMBLY_ACC=CAM_ASM_000868 /TAXON_ID=225041 /ORGANISM="Chlamydomonas chlamydogama, Strain SAG 11-48b" /LENGTH=350 /DNA_ID=CAMNT_0049583963 /DNA_START=227 /DNA_END=1279 /DNA_ORIENTATION=+
MKLAATKSRILVAVLSQLLLVSSLDIDEDLWSHLRYHKDVIDPQDTPCWMTMPGGRQSNWKDVNETMDCRAAMSHDLAKHPFICSPTTNHPPCNSHVAIVTMLSGKKAGDVVYLDIFLHTNSLIKKYCRYWGTCEVFSYLNPPSLALDPEAVARHPSWHKVWLVQQLIANHTAAPPTSPFTHYLWVDADAAIIDHSVDLRFVLAQGHNRTLIISHDMYNMGTAFNGVAANGGVWSVRNSPVGREMLQAWWQAPDTERANEKLRLSKERDFWEQDVFNLYLHARYPHEVHVLPMCYLYGYPLSLLDKPFIAHLAGTVPGQSIRYFKFWDDRTHMKHKHPHARHWPGVADNI